MKIRGVAGVIGVVLLGSACAKKADLKSQASELAQSFAPALVTNEQQAAAAEIVNVALAAVRQNDYAGGVMALQSVEHLPNMTAEQLRVVQETIQTLTSDLVTRAANGDAKAQAELAAIERTRSQ